MRRWDRLIRARVERGVGPAGGGATAEEVQTGGDRAGRGQMGWGEVWSDHVCAWSRSFFPGFFLRA